MTEPKSKFQIFWARYGGTGFIISVVLHGTLLLAATAWVVNEIVTTQRQEMQAPPKQETQKRAQQIDFTIQTARQQSRATSQPMNVQRIAVQNSSALQLPETPSLPTSGFGGDFNIGAGSGGLSGFKGAGGGGSGPVVKIPPFGLKSMQAGTFKGELYDLKQTPGGKLIEPRVNFATVMRNFFASNWNRAQLRKYFQAPQPLYTTQFYIPWMQAIEAPKAFGVEQQVAPSNWIALYEAKVSPPTSGRYRFIGAADDLIAVRFNNKLVLEAYWLSLIHI